jgi:hypothetical protein
MEKDLNKTLGKRSVINPDKKCTQILKEKIDFVLNEEVKKGPFISWVSVEQLIQGGIHWKNCDYELIAGLVEHMGWKRGANWARDQWEKACGWDPGKLPYKFNENVRAYMKKEILNYLANHLDEIGILPFFTQGYIDPSTLVFDVTKSNSISGYFFLRVGDMFVNTQNDWLFQCFQHPKKRFIAIQYEYNRQAYKFKRRSQIKATLGKLNMLEAYQEMNHEQIDMVRFNLEKKFITWSEDDYDE